MYLFNLFSFLPYKNVFVQFIFFLPYKNVFVQFIVFFTL